MTIHTITMPVTRMLTPGRVFIHVRMLTPARLLIQIGMLAPARLLIHVGVLVPARLFIHVGVFVPARLVVHVGVLVPGRVVVGCGVGSGFGRITGIAAGVLDIVPTPLWACPVAGGVLLGRLRKVGVRFLPGSLGDITSRFATAVPCFGSRVVRCVVLIRGTPRPRWSLRFRHMTRRATMTGRRATMMPRRSAMR